MARRVSEDMKIDLAIAPQIISASGTTSKYFSLKDYDRALFCWAIHFTGATTAVTAGQTSANTLASSVATLYQAKNASAATSATAISSGTAIISFYTKVTEFTIVPGVASAADTISITGYDINGDANTALTFTAENGGTSAYTASTSRYFSINDTASGTGIISNICTTLAAIINDDMFGLPNAYASASTTSVTVRSVEVGETVFSFTSSTTTNMTVISNHMIGFAEVNASSLTLSSDFTHVAINITNETALLTDCWCIRKGRKRHMPVQMVADSVVVGE